MTVMTSKVRVYMGCSLDGYIAGPDHDLDWLSENHAAADTPPASPDYLNFEQFMSQIGCLLMGRTTYDIVAGFDQWLYGNTPVLVATTRLVDQPLPSVQSATGSIEELITTARALAGDKDIYLDGGNLVQQALNAGLVDEMTLTVLPVILSAGTRLFDHLTARHRGQFLALASSGDGMVQMTIRLR